MNEVRVRLGLLWCGVLASAVACGSSGSEDAPGSDASAGTGGSGGSAGAAVGGSAGSGTGGSAGSSGGAGGSSGSAGSGAAAGSSGSAGSTQDGGGGDGSVPDQWPMQWLKVIGGAERDGLEDVVATSSGKVLVAGGVSIGTNFGDGPLAVTAYRDIAVAELTTSGDAVWSKAFPGPGDESAVQIVESGANIALAGQLGSSSWSVARLGAAGAELWKKSFGFNGGLTGVAIDSGGAVFASAHGTSGNFGAGALPPHGQMDVFIGNLAASDGSQVWAQGLGGTAADFSGALTFDSSGALIVCGSHIGVVDFGTGPVGTSGNRALFVLRMQANGNVTWVKSYPLGTQSKEVACSDVAAAPNGDLLLTGWFNPQIDFEGQTLTAEGIANDMFVLRLSSAGQIVWVKDYGSFGDEFPRSIAVASDGRVAFAGKLWSATTLGTLTFNGQNSFVAELNPATGEVTRAKRFSPLPLEGSLVSEIGGIAFVPSGSLIVAGNISGPVIVEGVGYYDKGKGDGVVFSLAP